MLAKADAFNGGPVQDECMDLSRLSDEELWALEALLAKARACETLAGGTAGHQPYKPELLEPETLARIAKG